MTTAKNPKHIASPLWGTAAVDADILAFTAGEDQVLDNELLVDDITASIGHVGGLMTAGILSSVEAEFLTEALKALREETVQGTFRVGPADEDGHSAIERVLTERLGDVGKKVHTGRSRNDQVLVALRLHARRRLSDIAHDVAALARACLHKAEQHKFTVMPGYTHLQRAMPSTMGFFFAGHAECFAEDVRALMHARALVDRSPLGTAAGYGISLPLPRDDVAHALGFSGIVVNGLCAQNGRGRLDAHVVSSLLTFLASARRLAWDLSLFTMAESGFVKMPDRFTTGSSIMPNKRNPDVVELVRAAFADVAGAHTALLQAIALPSAYHRDLQVTKGPLIRALNKASQVARVLTPLITELTVDVDACARALEPALLATDLAVEKAKAGVPFRDAYLEVKKAIAEIPETDLTDASIASVVARVSPGAPGNLMLERIAAHIDDAVRS
jgi:argininosuccinate lyase